MNKLKLWCEKNNVDYEYYETTEHWAEGGYGVVSYEYINFKGKEHLLYELESFTPDLIICGNIAVFRN